MSARCWNHAAMTLIGIGFVVTSVNALSHVVWGQTAADWRDQWAVRPGFVIERDTEGYQWPTAIAFVPRPRSRPDDPLYFVAELRGKVKVVTNDRKVHTFAEAPFNVTPTIELPAMAGEVGMAGICLDAPHGYVFVTLAHRDGKGVLRNNVIRFTSRPGVFSLRPTAAINFSVIFSRDMSAPSHQIGGCQVRDGMLYVGIGDGLQHLRSRDLMSSLGKILRLSVDGRPLPGNPFYQGERRDDIRSYVWAYGLRNPFGIEIVNGRVFVAENGPGVDRFLEVRSGADYFWDGTDFSIGTNALAVFSPPIAPVQLAYYSDSRTEFPQEYRESFFMAASAGTTTSTRFGTGIVTVRMDWRHGRLSAVPQYLMRYRGDSMQMVVGLAFGPDGLYFAPLYPDGLGVSAVYRVRYAPAAQYPTIIGHPPNAVEVMEGRGCFGCHSIDGRGGTLAPPLDSGSLVNRLYGRLHSKEYERAIDELDRSSPSQDPRFSEARRRVLAAQGLERVRVWLTQKIQTPQFDNPAAQMPQLDVSDAEAAIVAEYLLQGAESRFSLAALRRRLPPPKHRYTVFGFAAGVVLMLAATVVMRARRNVHTRPR